MIELNRDNLQNQDCFEYQSIWVNWEYISIYSRWKFAEWTLPSDRRFSFFLFLIKVLVRTSPVRLTLDSVKRLRYLRLILFFVSFFVLFSLFCFVWFSFGPFLFYRSISLSYRTILQPFFQGFISFDRYKNWESFQCCQLPLLHYRYHWKAPIEKPSNTNQLNRNQSTNFKCNRIVLVNERKLNRNWGDLLFLHT